MFTACPQASKEAETTSGKEKRYELKGKVLSVDKANKKASIKHEEIPDYMSGMTMDFTFKEDWVWNVLTEGAEINAILVVDNSKDPSYWLEKPRIVASSLADETTPKVREEASVGKEIPDFTLTNQNGEPVSAKNFRGKTLAITFIYSECPIADFCIAMSKNFSDLANEVAGDKELEDKIRLLSISFDPKRDTPEKLKQYGLGYLGKDSKATDFKIWQLAVGENAKIKKVADFFGLKYKVDSKDKTQFAHSLRTIVISPDGKVQKVFSGNDWKPKDLLSEMKKTFGEPK